MATLKKLIVGIALVCLASPAMAEMFDSLYVAVDLGRSTFKNSCSGVYTSCKEFDFSHRTSLGLLVANFTNAEIGYYSSGQAVKNAGNNSNTIDSVEWQLSGIRNFPIGEGRLSALARLGIVHWEAAETNTSGHINASGNSVLLGVGGKFFITKSTIVRLLYETHKVGNSKISWRGNVNFLSAGLSYQFY